MVGVLIAHSVYSDERGMTNFMESDHGAEKRGGMFGEELIWLFILGDMATFSLFFLIYGYARADEPQLFRTSQEALSVHYGSINTLILLISSWFVVLAAKAARTKQYAATKRYLITASLFGAFFAALKIFEYREKLAEGYTFDTDNFFMFYYLLTGLHFAHFLTGIGLLAYFAWVFGKGKITDSQFGAFESGAIFWHMVDLLWVIIFPLLYLLP